MNAQVTIEINTNLPKKEPKEPKTPNDEQNKDKESQGTTFEFKIPPELLQ